MVVRTSNGQQLILRTNPTPAAAATAAGVAGTATTTATAAGVAGTPSAVAAVTSSPSTPGSITGQRTGYPFGALFKEICAAQTLFGCVDTGRWKFF